MMTEKLQQREQKSNSLQDKKYKCDKECKTYSFHKKDDFMHISNKIRFLGNDICEH